MAEAFSFAERTDMLLVYGFCGGNCQASVREYSERFPNRRLPNPRTFAAVERRLRETGRFDPVNPNRGRPRTARTADVEEAILDAVADDPKLSTRRLGLQIGTSKSTVNLVLREQLLHPYHIQPVQDLLPIDPEQRLRFCRFVEEKRLQDENFHKKILFTDESCFTRSGVTNLHNEHVYCDENPHATKVTHFQHEFKINVWAGVVDNFILGPVRLPPRLNGENYLQFLQTTFQDLLDDLPLENRRDLWFMQDGAPPHFTLNVRNHLHQVFPNKWIGRGQDAPVKWPPRSPDITPCDYFLWGALKAAVYATAVNTEEQLWRRIQDAADNLRNNDDVMQRVQSNFLRRIRLCAAENGGHFEQLL